MAKTFRVKEESSLDKLLDLVLSGELDGGITQKALYESGFTYNSAWMVFELSRMCDNFMVSKHSSSYVDVVPSTTVIQDSEVITTESTQSQYDGPSVLWPETPIVNDVDDMPWFRRPSWYNRMAAMIQAGKNISLAGPPGIGKSSAVEYLAAEQGKVLVNISADAGLRRRDLTGNVELIDSHTQFQVAEYLAAVRNGWWVKIDEVNAAEPDALMYLNSQIAPPYSASFYGKSVKRHPDFRLFVTYNPGLVGTKPLPPAFKDRFFPIKLDFPNEAQLRRMLEANGMPDANWTSAIIKFGLEAWQAHMNGRMRYQITPRRLMDAVDLVQLVGEGPIQALEQAVIAAVDSHAEVKALEQVLSSIKQAFEYGRL